MAYIIRNPKTNECKGPFPNRPGEFSGNVDLNTLHMFNDGSFDFIPALTDEVITRTTGRYMIGQPVPTKGETNDELAAQELVGLYLREGEDNPTVRTKTAKDWIIEIDTDILMEPVVLGLCPPSRPFSLKEYVALLVALAQSATEREKPKDLIDSAPEERDTVKAVDLETVRVEEKPNPAT